MEEFDTYCTIWITITPFTNHIFLQSHITSLSITCFICFGVDAAKVHKITYWFCTFKARVIIITKHSNDSSKNIQVAWNQNTLKIELNIHKIIHIYSSHKKRNHSKLSKMIKIKINLGMYCTFMHMQVEYQHINPYVPS